MALRHAEYAKLAYDRVAEDYDDTFGPQAAVFSVRLNERLALAAGPAGPGSGLRHRHQRGRHRARGRARRGGRVDYSEGMLAEARERADAAGVTATFCHARAEEFIAQAPAESYDVVSMRFVLAYVDWKTVLPGIGRIMRRGGRFGLLTSLSGSIPQFYELYRASGSPPSPPGSCSSTRSATSAPPGASTASSRTRSASRASSPCPTRPRRCRSGSGRAA